MKKKLIISAIIFLLISVFSFYYAFKPSEIVIDFNDPAYSYLPESAKILIENEAKKGNRVKTYCQDVKQFVKWTHRKMCDKE